MPKTRDQYRKVRRALAKAKRFKMKGQVLTYYIKVVRRRVAKLAVLVVVVSGVMSCACITDPSPAPSHQRHDGVKQKR